MIAFIAALLGNIVGAILFRMWERKHPRMLFMSNKPITYKAQFTGAYHTVVNRRKGFARLDGVTDDGPEVKVELD